MRDLRAAIERVLAARREFLMVGRRWDTEITSPCDFKNPDWQKQIRGLALKTNKQRTSDWIDYFVFSRGFFVDLPPLVVGRVHCDDWTVWKALEMKKPVVDASRVVTPSIRITITGLNLTVRPGCGTEKKPEQITN
jgi:hypothetical protein